MGCDIHMYAEIKRNGKWEEAGAVFDNMWHDPNHPNKDKDSFYAKLTIHPYDGRNYNLFAILADVRNGRGFAGIKTGEGFNPISEPRGIPKDATDFYKEKVEDWNGDGHSHSYHTLKDLLDYNWDQMTMQQGIVMPGEYETYKKNGRPDGWSGDISGPMVVKLSNEEMDKLIYDGIPNDGKTYCTLVRWGTTYRDAVSDWWFEKTLPRLQELVENPEDIRIVFFFDN